MFLAHASATERKISFPRVRGDVPMRIGPCDVGDAFSPRARGCSAGPEKIAENLPVFPAYAGMFRLTVSLCTFLTCFPRVRGDVPDGANQWPAPPKFSPRARGCSGLNLRRELLKRVFPACAGMFPSRGCRRGCRRCFPRVRGDVPKDCPVPHRNPGFSPRARGCSRMGNHVQKGGIVFPCRGYSYQV